MDPWLTHIISMCFEVSVIWCCFIMYINVVFVISGALVVHFCFYSA